MDGDGGVSGRGSSGGGASSASGDADGGPASAASASSNRLRAEGAIAFMCIIWGFSFVSVKDAFTDASPMVFLASRFVAASAVMVPLESRRGIARDKARRSPPRPQARSPRDAAAAARSCRTRCWSASSWHSA